MTILIGITARKGKKGVILGTDTTRTYERESSSYNEAGLDKVYLEQRKRPELAICMTGQFDDDYANFLAQLRKRKIDFREVLKRPIGKIDQRFAELKELNEFKWHGAIPDLKRSNGLLIATRYDNQPKLYVCYPLGAIAEKRNFISIGNGADYSTEFLNRQAGLVPEERTLNQSIDLADKALEEASKHVSAEGLNLAAITADGIQSFGEEIKREYLGFKRNMINTIKKRVSGKIK